MRFNLTEKTNSTSENSEESFKKIISELNQLNVELEAKKLEMKNQFKNSLEKVIQSFFIMVPEVKSLTWTQYTPYFNDGDACYFSMGDIYFSSDNNEDFEPYREDECEDYWSSTSNELDNVLSPDKAKFCIELDNLLCGNSDFLEELLGDHKIIRITESGIDAQDYDHD